MEREDIETLMAIAPETRMDAERILFALEKVPDGTNTTTYQQSAELLGCDVDADFAYLFDLHMAVMLLSETHGLKLDMSRHDYKEEGLPFNLDYDVWHRKDAASNGQFDDEASPEKRDWKDEHDDMVADAIAGILAKALPACVIPPKLRFSHENVPVLDAEILEVSCLFDAAGLSFSLGFEINTGRFSLRAYFEPEPEPSTSGIDLTCECQDKGFEATWDPETGEWNKPLPLDAPQPGTTFFLCDPMPFEDVDEE